METKDVQFKYQRRFPNGTYFVDFTKCLKEIGIISSGYSERDQDDSEQYKAKQRLVHAVHQ